MVAIIRRMDACGGCDLGVNGYGGKGWDRLEFLNTTFSEGPTQTHKGVGRSLCVGYEE